MPDERSLREKLEAMATQTETSPAEARIAAALLRRLNRNRPPVKTPGVLTREAARSSPDRDLPVPRVVRIRMPSGVWLTMDEEDVDWGWVRGLSWRYIDE